MPRSPDRTRSMNEPREPTRLTEPILHEHYPDVLLDDIGDTRPGPGGALRGHGLDRAARGCFDRRRKPLRSGRRPGSNGGAAAGSPSGRRRSSNDPRRRRNRLEGAVSTRPAAHRPQQARARWVLRSPRFSRCGSTDCAAIWSRRGSRGSFWRRPRGLPASRAVALTIEILEQSQAIPYHDGHDAHPQLVDQACVEQLLYQAGAPTTCTTRRPPRSWPARSRTRRPRSRT